MKNRKTYRKLAKRAEKLTLKHKREEEEVVGNGKRDEKRKR